MASEIDQDIVAFVGGARGSLIETLHVRAGRVVGTRAHFIGTLDVTSPDEDPRDWLSSFLNQYYEDNVIPDEVLLAVPLGDDLTRLLEDVLKERRGGTVRVRYGGDSASQKLVEMAERNAKEHFKTQLEKTEEKNRGLFEIQKKLHLQKLPQRIECFDISHFQGYETVASQTVFVEGVPDTDQYRMYRIREATGGDDYACMKEVLHRRLQHREWDDPDLIVIDGGKGQLKMAVEVLHELGRQDIPVVGLAKARTERDFQSSEVQASQERFFLPGRSNPVTFKSNSEAFRILVSARDEAHRFALNYHRKLREGTLVSGALDFVKGLGPAKRKALLDRFGTVENLRKATPEELAQVSGVTPTLAEEVLRQLQHLGGESTPDRPDEGSSKDPSFKP